MEEACSKTLVQLYGVPIWIFLNHTASLENKVKEQVATLELGHMFVLCGNSCALCTHIPNIVVWIRREEKIHLDPENLYDGCIIIYKVSCAILLPELWLSTGDWML